MFWFQVYLTGDFKGTYYAPDAVEATKECMLRNKRQNCSVALVSWLVDGKDHCTSLINCCIKDDGTLSYLVEEKDE